VIRQAADYTCRVDVTLSKRGSYAVAAAICLARAYPAERPKKLREISAEMDIPRTFVSQILGDLVHAGIAVSFPGRDGGHRLARSPEQVSVAEVIEAAEGPLASERCALGDGPCRWQAVCPMHETITTATASLRQVLASTTLAVLAERDAAIASGTYPVPADAHPRPATVAVADTVQIELPAPVVAARLSAGISWLTAHAEACDSEELRIRVGPGWTGKTVAVHLGQPVQAGKHLVIPLIWEASGPAGIFPRFEGELRLSSVDPERSELRLSGRYRPALGKTGQALNDTLLTRLASATLRSFLRRIAQGLEHEHTSPGSAPQPVSS
jgi:Rrf2 family protein